MIYHLISLLHLQENKIELLSERAIQYMKRDPAKQIIEYDCGSLANFLSLDLQEAEWKGEAVIQEQIKQIREQEVRCDGQLMEEDAIKESLEEESVEDIMIKQHMNQEQIAEMTKAILRGVPETVLMDIARKNPSPERIRLIASLYGEE